MRNPKRIRPFLEELATLWEKYPDLRFGQLYQMITDGKDLFYLEDNVWLEKIQELKAKIL